MSQVFPLPEHRHPHDDGSSDVLGAFVRLESTGGTGVDRITWHSTSGGAGWEVTTPTSSPAVPVEGYYDLRGEIVTPHTGDLTIWLEVDGSRIWPQDADFDTITTDGTIAFDLAAGVMAVNQTMTIRFDPAIDVTSAEAIAQFIHTQTHVADLTSTTVSGGWGEVVHAIDDAGSQLWTYSVHTNDVKGLDIDEGYAFSASWDSTVAKLDLADGTEQWRASHDTGGEGFNCVVVSPDNGVLAGSGNGNVYKLDNADGSLIWKDTGRSFNVNAITVDGSDNAYVGYSDGSVRKLDSSGSELWTIAVNNLVHGIDVLSDGSGIWVAGSPDLTRLDGSGTEVWSVAAHTGDVHDVSVDTSSNSHTGGTWEDPTVKKFDPDGTELWSFGEHTSDVYAVDVESDGNVHSVSGDATVKKIDENGSIVWTYEGHGTGVIAVSAIAE